MSPEAQRVAIAEACGWTGILPAADDPSFLLGFHADKPNSSPVKSMSGRWPVPDYLTDLNACHEMEKVLEGIEDGSYDYSKKLKAVCGHNWTWQATAAQRAEAFLRTLNLWDDSK